LPELYQSLLFRNFTIKIVILIQLLLLFAAYEGYILINVRATALSTFLASLFNISSCHSLFSLLASREFRQAASPFRANGHLKQET